jgi:hypothetical protein
MLTTLTTAIWFQKAKATADAIWGVSSLFCVPGVIFATVCVLVPAHGGGHGWDIRSVAQAPRAPQTYEPAPGTGGPTAYRLGLFDSRGQLVHEYPDQVITPSRNVQRGSIVVEIPDDVPPGEYSLRVFKDGSSNVRDIPLKVGDHNERVE